MSNAYKIFAATVYLVGFVGGITELTRAHAQTKVERPAPAIAAGASSAGHHRDNEPGTHAAEPTAAEG